MKYLLFFVFLTIKTASASILDPILECKSSDPELIFKLDNPQSGNLFYKKKICPFLVDSFDSKNQTSTLPGYDIIFSLNKCHTDLFVQKGFLRIAFEGERSKNVSAYILALKNHQTLICKTSFKSAKKAFERLEKAQKALPLED